MPIAVNDGLLVRLKIAIFWEISVTPRFSISEQTQSGLQRDQTTFARQEPRMHLQI